MGGRLGFLIYAPGGEGAGAGGVTVLPPLRLSLLGLEGAQLGHQTREPGRAVATQEASVMQWPCCLREGPSHPPWPRSPGLAPVLMAESVCGFTSLSSPLLAACTVLTPRPYTTLGDAPLHILWPWPPLPIWDSPQIKPKSLEKKKKKGNEKKLHAGKKTTMESRVNYQDDSAYRQRTMVNRETTKITKALLIVGENSITLRETTC